MSEWELWAATFIAVPIAVFYGVRGIFTKRG